MRCDRSRGRVVGGRARSRRRRSYSPRSSGVGRAGARARRASSAPRGATARAEPRSRACAAARGSPPAPRRRAPAQKALRLAGAHLLVEREREAELDEAVVEERRARLDRERHADRVLAVEDLRQSLQAQLVPQGVVERAPVGPLEARHSGGAMRAGPDGRAPTDGRRSARLSGVTGVRARNQRPTPALDLAEARELAWQTCPRVDAAEQHPVAEIRKDEARVPGEELVAALSVEDDLDVPPRLLEDEPLRDASAHRHRRVVVPDDPPRSSRAGRSGRDAPSAA